MEGMGLKAKDFEAMWKDNRSHLEAIEVLSELREKAKEQPTPSWSLEALDAAVQGAPNKGKGTDQMNMDDIRRLPPAGREAFVTMYNSCEEKIA